MKATTIILTALLSLTACVNFAGNETTTVFPLNDRNGISLVPATPAPATFEDYVEVIAVALLAPVTPSEAAFEEMPDETASVSALAPVASFMVNFDDSAEVAGADIRILAPVIPVEVDFE